ncbi:ion channel protein [Agromyces tardus]|uniref:Ion channel protein n=1 Tax=Agromyces tardus TaxID=2583849 RepID=A0A3M8AJA3_9MICO|nr:ion channel protein [Agromyces tardus]RNB51268.1 ion channel protein [Agromyces tardus]
MKLAVPERDPNATPRRLLLLAIPAIAVGILAALVLWSVDAIAGALDGLLWTTWPDALGVDPSGWWIVLVLTTTGLAVGLALTFVPGHGGPDSATTELTPPPMKLSALPGLALVTILALAGGVSLGPENPVIAINATLIAAILARLLPQVPGQLAMLLATSATIGALFDTPVAAALIFTGVVAAVKAGGSLWDRLFLPLVSAGAGAMTMHLLGAAVFAFDVPPYDSPQAIDLLTGSAVAIGAALVGLAALAAFPWVYRAFHAMRHPIIVTTVGGLVLGLLGLIGGPITMFKGLEQMGELLQNADDYDGAQLAAIAGIKTVALLVAASALFRGGRVFPATFIGVALGMLGHVLIPGLPLGLAVACGVLGLTLVVTRDGWVAIFLGVAIGGDITLLPVLCVVVLPVWLMVTGAPEFRIQPPAPAPADPSATHAPPGPPEATSAR